MTPKEKAIELFDKYDYILWKEYNNFEAKRCALIAVDEIINTGLLSNQPIKHQAIADIHTEYWKEVKQEIENI